MPTPLPWRLKRWDGAAFVDAELRRWNGASFTTADMYFWDGADWVLCTDRTPPTETYNEQYNSTWWNAFNGSNNDSGQVSAYQGYYDGVHGIQKSMFGFDYAAIDTALSGRTATYSCQVYLDNTHWYYGSGGYAVVGTHVATSVPSTFSYNRYNSPGSIHFTYGQAKWTTVTNDLAAWFDAQSARGITLYADSFDATYYGYFVTSASLYFSYEK